MTKGFIESGIIEELLQGSFILEKISRETSVASAINLITANSLKLDTKDTSGNNKTVEFSLSDTDVRLLENNSFIGNLNTANITVTALTFTQINTTKGTAVKIFLTVRSNHDVQNRDENFYSTVVLRGDY
jgi:hypothetical protein